MHSLYSYQDFLYPEETLLKEVSPDSKIERPIGGGFFIFLFFSLGIVMIFIFSFYFYNQIFKNKFYADLANKNRYIEIPIVGPRGIIFSSDNKILADNQLFYSLWIVLKDKNKDFNKIENLAQKISSILQIDKKNIMELIRENINKEVFLVAENISKDQKELLEKEGIKEFYILDNYRRTYNRGEIFSNFIGYVGRISEEDIKDNNENYSFLDYTGKQGLEKYYQDYLAGKNGKFLIERFSNDNNSIKILNPAPGKNIYLNIDSVLQENLYNELSKAIKENGLNAGLAIAQNPNDGRVLAMVSFPSFDNNLFLSNSNPGKIDSILNDKNSPLLNRVISGLFPPGSTIKPLIAIAALEEGVINPEKKIYAPSFITISNPYNPDKIYTFKDWKFHGWIDMKKAIAHSSDVYFYTVGGGYYDVNGLGIDKINKYLKIFKIDTKLGIDLPGEKQGFSPTKTWKKEVRGEEWFKGDTFNISIGQGDLLVTPIWLNTYIGAIANSGKIFRPFLVNKIVLSNDQVIEIQPQIISELNLNQANLRIIKEGMKEAAIEGTANIFRDLPFPVGAKSGTAEIIKGLLSHSWITVFAPYDNPQITLTIMTESRGGGFNLPAKIAFRILNDYFK